MLKEIKKTTLYLFLFTFCLNVFSQESLINAENEYKSAISTHPEYYEITARYTQALLINNRVDESFKILEFHINTVKKLNEHDNISFLYAIKAIQCFIINDKINSEKSLAESKKHLDKCKKLETKGYVAYTSGWLAIRNGKEVEAVNDFLEAIEFYENAPKTKALPRRRSVIYGELARIYANWNDFNSQEKYTLKSLENAIAQKNQDAIFSAYMSVGNMYVSQLRNNHNDTEIKNLAEKNFLKAISLFDKNSMTYESDLSYAYINLASLYLIHFPDSYLDKALYYTNLGKTIALKHLDTNHLASIYGLLAEIKLRENKTSEAKDLLIKGLHTLEKSIRKDTSIEFSIYESLTDIEVEQGDYKAALAYQKEYLNVYKRVFDLEKLELSKKIESDFEKKLHFKELEKLQLIAGKKEQEIEMLQLETIQKQNENNNLKLIQENQTKKILLSELEAERKLQEIRLYKLETLTKSKDIAHFKEKLYYKELTNTFYIALIILIAILLALTLYLLKQRTKSLKQKEKIFESNLEKEKQNSKISTLTALLEGQELERGRLAKDLHDGLGGVLSAIKIQLSDIYNKNEENNHHDLKKAINHLDFAIEKLRKVSHNLMPDMLIKFGLEVALREFASRMTNPNLDINVQFLSFNNKLETEKQLFIYRIIQELVNNVIKHAEASQIIIQLVEDTNFYYVTVEDDGKGFDYKSDRIMNSAGLLNIESRVKYLKGTLNIHSQINLGTSIDFNFPKK